MRYEIVPATPLHVGPLIRRMTDASQKIMMLGGRPRAWLRYYIGASIEPKVALLDGVPVAVWGYLGSPLGTDVTVWANFSEVSRAHPLAVVRVARADIARMLETVRQIEGRVLASDARARRFAEFLGFTVWEDEPVHDNGVLCYPITRCRA